MTGRKYKTLDEALEVLERAPHKHVKEALVTIKEEIATLQQSVANMHYRLYGAGCKPGGTAPWMRAGRQRESK